MLAGGKRHWRSFRRLAANDLRWARILARCCLVAARWDKGIVVLTSTAIRCFIGTRGGAFWYRTGSRIRGISAVRYLCAQAGMI